MLLSAFLAEKWTVQNFCRELVFSADLCYNGTGDENGSWKRVTAKKAFTVKKFRLQHSRGIFYNDMYAQQKMHVSRVVGAIHESPEIELTDYGKIIDKTIRNIPERYKATVDRYVIMPNHIHLIIIITDDEELRAIRESPLRGRSVISKVIGYVKMNASKEIHGKYDDAVIWQRGFHDHIIRDRRDYEKIAKYIYENPIRWQYDCFFAEE